MQPAHLKAAGNPAQYVSFSHPLAPDGGCVHALSRLTFGATAEDLAKVRSIGLERWITQQLHPDLIPENPVLAEKLQPLTSLELSPRQAALQYPSPQVIAAVAHGKAALPDDPELRAVVYQLASRYLEKKGPDGRAKGAGALPDPDDDPTLVPRMELTSILSAGQIQTLRDGTPTEKTQVMETIRPERRFDFVWSLRPGQRKALINFAPLALRRDLILSLNPQRVVAEDLTQAKLLRAVYSDRQLQELLVDFWYNHFNVFLDKGADRYLATSYERDSIRPHVLGKFHDLLLATAQSPAMLFYLDNWQSVGAGSPQSAGGKRGLNENYGRELLELHTVGVDGGYTQGDVIDVARCFTGWTIAAPRKGGGFEYNDKMHDKGRKVVLGHVIAAGGGMDDGLKVLDILAHQPATAHFISLKLARRFVADDPPPSLVNRMAETFLEDGGDLREVMSTMLHSPEFWSQGAYRAKVKTPFEVVASELRVTGADVELAANAVAEIQKLGEPLYRKIEPTGYSSANAEWVSSGALLERMNFSMTLARNHVPGVKVDATKWAVALNDPISVAGQLLEQAPGEATMLAIRRELSDVRPMQSNPQTVGLQAHSGAFPAPPEAETIVGLILGSPDFQRR